MNFLPNEKPLMSAVLGGARVIFTPHPQSYVNPAERDLASALNAIAMKHGTFDESGCGIYAGYEPAITNEDQNIGVKCQNCVLYKGNGECRIISFPVEPDGKCRFAVIPDGVVKQNR